MSYIIVYPPWKKKSGFFGWRKVSPCDCWFVVHFTQKVVGLFFFPPCWVTFLKVQRMLLSRTMWKNPWRWDHYLSYPKENKFLVTTFYSSQTYYRMVKYSVPPRFWFKIQIVFVKQCGPTNEKKNGKSNGFVVSCVSIFSTCSHDFIMLPW